MFLFLYFVFNYILTYHIFISLYEKRILNQVFYENEHISPTAHHALRKGLEPYPLYIAGHGPSFFNKNAVFEQQEPWERMLSRKYRLFHADVQLNAPKDRTLFNYNVKVSKINFENCNYSS